MLQMSFLLQLITALFKRILDLDTDFFFFFQKMMQFGGLRRTRISWIFRNLGEAICVCERLADENKTT